MQHGLRHAVQKLRVQRLILHLSQVKLNVSPCLLPRSNLGQLHHRSWYTDLRSRSTDIFLSWGLASRIWVTSLVFMLVLEIPRILVTPHESISNTFTLAYANATAITVTNGTSIKQAWDISIDQHYITTRCLAKICSTCATWPCPMSGAESQSFKRRKATRNVSSVKTLCEISRRRRWFRMLWILLRLLGSSTCELIAMAKELPF